jgi:hypothetical protein
MIDPKHVDEQIKQTWCDNWQEIHRKRILATGVSSIADFLRKYLPNLITSLAGM